MLDRLPHQAAAYDEVVDRATLIAAPRHVEKALALLPDWWGVIVVNHGATQGLRILRPERANRAVNPLMLARLLWRPEAVAILRELGRPEKLLRQPREILYQEMVAALSQRMLALRVLEVLKIREAWRDLPEPL